VYSLALDEDTDGVPVAGIAFPPPDARIEIGFPRPR
jgi:hypothetical protein